MIKEKWYKRDDIEYWKKEYLELSKQLEEKQIILDKIKEIALAGVEVNKSMGVKVKTGNDKILELLEEIE